MPPPTAANEIDYITWQGTDYFWSMSAAILFYQYVTVIRSEQEREFGLLLAII
jgi:hypothetical protein